MDAASNRGAHRPRLQFSGVPRLASGADRAAIRAALLPVLMIGIAACGGGGSSVSPRPSGSARLYDASVSPASGPAASPRSARSATAAKPARLLSRPVPLPAPVSLSHVGPYRFVRGPLVVRPGNRANAGNDDVDVFLRMNRPLPGGRVYITVNGVGAALTAAGNGFDIVAANATRWCYEVTIGNTETLTNTVHHYHLGEI